MNNGTETKSPTAAKAPDSQLMHGVSVLASAVIITLAFHIIQHNLMATIAQLVLPVPVVMVAVRYSLCSGMLVIAIATLLTGVLSDIWTGLLFFVGIGVAALVFALCFRRRYSATATISCISLYYVAIMTVIGYVQSGVTYEGYIQSLAASLKDQFIQVYEANGMAWQEIEAQLAALAHVLGLISPFVSALSTSVLMYFIIRFALTLQKAPLAPLTPFRQWKLADHLVWLIVLSGVLYHLEVTRVIGINMLIGVVFLYYLAGCAILLSFFAQRQAPKFVRIITYVILLLQIPYIFVNLGLLLSGYTQGVAYLALPFIFIVTGIGLANVWFDFRQRIMGQNQ
jgi:hypothetical protein